MDSKLPLQNDQPRGAKLFANILISATKGSDISVSLNLACHLEGAERLNRHAGRTHRFAPTHKINPIPQQKRSIAGRVKPSQGDDKVYAKKGHI